jgi:tRNA modification GTPase
VSADTIFALSSGSPPAAVAVVRISGPRSDAALEALAGRLPAARRATVATLRDRHGEVLDRALMLRFPGPGTATGEDVAELHLHGGRAVVAAVLRTLAGLEGLRAAEPGEFTRRAFVNGRIDLAEAEGLADLLAAETDRQRRSALAMAGGALSCKVEAWRTRILALSAALEATLDFSDEGEVGEAWPAGWREGLDALSAELADFLAQPPAERLRDGIRVAVAGPPNSGKSSLVNYLAQRDAAITSPVPGTTRDLIEIPLAIGGIPFLLTDTAGLRDSEDPVEAIGVARAHAAVAGADLVLWLGAPEERTVGRVILVQSKADLGGARAEADFLVSAVSGEGMDALTVRLREEATALLPGEGEIAANNRQRAAVEEAGAALRGAARTGDMLIAAEGLRQARTALDRVVGRAGVEAMLDTLFGRFCIGK